jgi:EpsI family protein
MISTSRFWCVSLTLWAAIVGLHLLPHGREASLPKPLASLPLTLDQWHGVEVPFDESIVRALAVDDYVNRMYEDETREQVGLYIGYVKRQRTDESLHSPQNCLPGAGWQPLASDHLWLTSRDGRPTEVNRYLVQKGLNRQVVLYWYQSHGRTIASEYKARIDMVVDAIYLHRTDAALVRINTPITGDRSNDRVVAFADAILGRLDGLIPK